MQLYSFRTGGILMAGGAPGLADFLPIKSEILASLGLQHTLTAACEFATTYFTAHHSALLLFSPDNKFGTVFAEFPQNFGAIGTKIPVAGVPHEERLIKEQQPIAIPDVEIDNDLGPVKGILLGLGIRSILIVPIINGGRVQGSFSVDILKDVRKFDESDLQMARRIAEDVARNIAAAEFFDRERSRAERLDALRRSALAINSQYKRPALLD